LLVLFFLPACFIRAMVGSFHTFQFKLT
jgi:hypothetical protein